MFIECSIQIQIIKTMPLDNLTTLPISHSCFWKLLFFKDKHYIIFWYKSGVWCRYIKTLKWLFWILFFWVQHISLSTSGDFFNCEEMGTHCECSFLINDRWKIYHRVVARWIYDIQLWPPNFIGWPLTIFAGWHHSWTPSTIEN